MKKLIGVSGLVFVFAILLGVIFISNATLNRGKIDLTEGKLYTLSPGTRNILTSLQEPITLNFYYSRQVASGLPINNYAKDVLDLLREYEQLAGGRIRLNVIDPKPFSDEEEAAVRAQVQGMPVNEATRLYFGLQGVNSTDGKEVIRFFDPQREQFLEYDVSKLIHRLSEARKPKAVLVTDLPIQGGNDMMAQMRGEPQRDEPWVVWEGMREMYDVELMSNNSKTVPDNTDVLVLVHPKDYTDEFKYSIDQFVMRGGRLMVFIDPLCEAERPPTNPNNPLQAMSAPKKSELDKLLNAWGVSMDSTKVVGDRRLGTPVNVGNQFQPEAATFVLYMGLREESINREIPPTQQLSAINVAMAGALKTDASTGLKYTPILQTTTESELIDVGTAQMFPDVKKMFRDFKPSGERQLLGVQITGRAKSAFPNGYTPPSEDKRDAGDDEKAAPPAGHLAEAAKDVQVVVFSDVDMLTDRMWVRVQRVLGMTIPQVFANNGDMMWNMTEWMTGSDSLLSLRARAKFTRPFTRIDNMVTEAQERFAEKQRGLEEELQKTQQRLNELMAQAPEGDSLMLTNAQLEKEIADLRLKEVETRREQRKLQLALREDVEKLSTRLQIINIAAIPLLVGVIAIGMGAWKTRRRRRR